MLMPLGAPISYRLPRYAVVLVGGLDQAEDAGTLLVRGTALLFKVAANGANHAVFVHLADVFKDVAGLRASFIPPFEELLESDPMSAEASRPLEADESC